MTENRGRDRLSKFDREGSAGYRQRQERRPREASPSRRRKKRRGRDSTAAITVICVAVLCLTLAIFAVWSAGKVEEVPAQQTAGTPIRAEEASQQVSDSTQQAEGNTVSTIQETEFQQLSDPLLVLVNDDVPLPDNWEVTPAFFGEQVVDQRIYNQLTDMFQAAAEDNVWLWVASGYRSVEDQERVLNADIQLHMSEGMSEEEARALSLRTINRPGHSEHHTGLVVDINDVNDSFEETEAYHWLSEHAADYGFVQRYRADKVEFTGIDNESWHYRYVGVSSAQEMQRLDMCLEEYVQYLKDQGIR